MWISVDPMADKYPSISPYAYCAWNPVKLVDPDGREIKFDPESEKIVNGFRERTEELEQSMCTPEQRKEYKDALTELTKLEESDQLYHITNIGSTYDREKGGTYYNAEDNSVCVEFDGKDGNLAHELKHAFQYETGKLSFKKDGSGFGELYDVTDEISALRRGGAWDKKQIETLRNVKYAYKFSVKNNPNIDSYYPFLDKAPNKHSLVGHRTTTRKVENAQSLGLDLSNDYYRMP